jgi:glycosyltransferase involved in cell wall biosynthesis
MKILVVSPNFPSPALPMRGLTSNEQFRLLKEAGHEVSAIVPQIWTPPGVPRPSWRRRRAVPLVETDHGVEIKHPRYFSIARFKRFPFSIVLQRRLFWNALQPSVDSFASGGGHIIHAHSSSLPGCMAGRTGNAQLVVSMLDDELFDVVPVSSEWRRAIVDTLRRADMVVYLSPLLRRLGIAAAGPHKTCVIPLAIDVYDNLRPPRAKAFTVSTVARLIERKKIHVLIDAFATFQREAPEARLIVIGEGVERPRLERLATQLGVGAAVQFTGNLPHREVVTQIAQSHVFMLPSVRESLGTVYFEAMSQGVPVVGTMGEGIADFIDEGKEGFLVRPDDPEPLVRLMRALQTEPELWYRISEGARRCYKRSKVRWTDSVSAHLDVFEQLIRQGRSSPESCHRR